MPRDFCKTERPAAFGTNSKRICSRSDCNPPVKQLSSHTSAALTVTDDTTDTLVGITTSRECNHDKEKEMSTYINVAEHIFWIRRIIGDDPCK